MMMTTMEKDQDLGLSLSLSAGASCARLVPPQLAVVMPSSSSSSSASPPFHPFPYTSSTSRHPKPHWSDLLLSHPDKIRPIMGTPLLRGIDVNQAPSSAAAVGERGSEEDGGSSSPNSTVSSVSGATKRSGRHPPCASDELDAERASSRGPPSDEEDGDGCRKKLRLSKDQSAVLEESFKEHSTLNPKQKMALAKRLNLRPRQVEVWFQNRRARTKLKQTEVDCEFLKRCCESLTEENRRLQKEVMELRALKLSPQLYMHMTPPTTLTMCPSCERVSNSSGAGAGPSNSSQPVRAASTAPSPLQQLPEQQNHQFLHHRRLVSPAPWAPVRLRPAFVDAPPQVS